MSFTGTFDARTCEEIGAYVYTLIDPRDQKPFYVGKGRGNRVFAHANDALETEVETDKLETVRAITKDKLQVKHMILRHGLDDATALTIESSLIDFARFFELELTNLVSGHHASAFGVMTTDEISRKFNSPPLDAIGSDCVLININKRYRETKGALSIYDVTKGYWSMANPDKKGVKFVLAEFRSFVVEVFEVEEWYQPEAANSTTQRWGFQGKVAPEDVRKLYLNKKIFKKRGSANPIAYNLQTPD